MNGATRHHHHHSRVCTDSSSPPPGGSSTSSARTSSVATTTKSSVLLEHLLRKGTTAAATGASRGGAGSRADFNIDIAAGQPQQQPAAPTGAASSSPLHRAGSARAETPPPPLVVQVDEAGEPRAAGTKSPEGAAAGQAPQLDVPAGHREELNGVLEEDEAEEVEEAEEERANDENRSAGILHDHHSSYNYTTAAVAYLRHARGAHGGLSSSLATVTASPASARAPQQQQAAAAAAAVTVPPMQPADLTEPSSAPAPAGSPRRSLNGDDDDAPAAGGTVTTCGQLFAAAEDFIKSGGAGAGGGDRACSSGLVSWDSRAPPIGVSSHPSPLLAGHSNGHIQQTINNNQLGTFENFLRDMKQHQQGHNNNTMMSTFNDSMKEFNNKVVDDDAVDSVDIHAASCALLENIHEEAENIKEALIKDIMFEHEEESSTDPAGGHAPHPHQHQVDQVHHQHLAQRHLNHHKLRQASDLTVDSIGGTRCYSPFSNMNTTTAPATAAANNDKVEQLSATVNNNSASADSGASSHDQLGLHHHNTLQRACSSARAVDTNTAASAMMMNTAPGNLGRFRIFASCSASSSTVSTADDEHHGAARAKQFTYYAETLAPSCSEQPEEQPDRVFDDMIEVVGASETLQLDRFHGLATSAQGATNQQGTSSGLEVASHCSAVPIASNLLGSIKKCVYSANDATQQQQEGLFSPEGMDLAQMLLQLVSEKVRGGSTGAQDDDDADANEVCSVARIVLAIKAPGSAVAESPAGRGVKREAGGGVKREADDNHFMIAISAPQWMHAVTGVQRAVSFLRNGVLSQGKIDQLLQQRGSGGRAPATTTAPPTMNKIEQLGRGAEEAAPPLGQKAQNMVEDVALEHEAREQLLLGDEEPLHDIIMMKVDRHLSADRLSMVDHASDDEVRGMAELYCQHQAAMEHSAGAGAAAAASSFGNSCEVDHTTRTTFSCPSPRPLYKMEQQVQDEAVELPAPPPTSASTYNYHHPMVASCTTSEEEACSPARGLHGVTTGSVNNAATQHHEVQVQSPSTAAPAKLNNNNNNNIVPPRLPSIITTSSSCGKAANTKRGRNTKMSPRGGATILQRKKSNNARGGGAAGAPMAAASRARAIPLVAAITAFNRTTTTSGPAPGSSSPSKLDLRGAPHALPRPDLDLGPVAGLDHVQEHLVHHRMYENNNNINNINMSWEHQQQHQVAPPPHQLLISPARNLHHDAPSSYNTYFQSPPANFSFVLSG